MRGVSRSRGGEYREMCIRCKLLLIMVYFRSYITMTLRLDCSSERNMVRVCTIFYV